MRVLKKLSSASKRWLIRRAYNMGNLVKARELARSELTNQLNKNFAKDIIVRSLYNEQKWEEVIRFSEDFRPPNWAHYRDKASVKLVGGIDFIDAEPENYSHCEWDGVNLLSNWYQEKNILWLRHPRGWIYWKMPMGFFLKQTHSDLLSLSMELLLSPFVPSVKKWKAEGRAQGTMLALAYSGGIDSTAAALLLPDDTILTYHQRDFKSMINHDLPFSTFEAMRSRYQRKVHCIPSKILPPSWLFYL